MRANLVSFHFQKPEHPNRNPQFRRIWFSCRGAPLFAVLRTHGAYHAGTGIRSQTLLQLVYFARTVENACSVLDFML